jgi:hypothetical protein
VTDAAIRQRSLTYDEKMFANNVFSDDPNILRLLPYDRITLTNLSGLGGRPFTMPGVDGRIYVHIGNAYDDPRTAVYPDSSYATPGQIFIHELVHVWQIDQSSFEPGTTCEGIVTQANRQVGQSVYQYGPPGPNWQDFNLEQQGAIVDQWFAGTATAVVPNRKKADSNDPYYPYIKLVRLGQTAGAYIP